MCTLSNSDHLEWASLPLNSVTLAKEIRQIKMALIPQAVHYNSVASLKRSTAK